MAENTNTERADFEAWYIAKIRESLPSAGDGWIDDQIRDSFMGFSQDRGYRSSSAQQAWGAWQARASLSLPAAGQEPVALEPERSAWINPCDKSQDQYLPHIGEPVLFKHEGRVYTGKHTGGSFKSDFPLGKHFDTWNCVWAYPSALDSAAPQPAAPMAGQEPVAWSYVPSKVWGDRVFTDDPVRVADAKTAGCNVTPLYAAPQPAAPYSIDADPQGIRSTVADAIAGALAFGAQGVNQPPTGHWLVPFWETAREEASHNRPVSSDTLYLLRRLLSNQHTLTGSEFREELTKIVGEATQAADSVPEDAARLERERICAAIKAEDDYCVDQGDYMLDSDDCIKIVRGEWVRPDFSVDAARKQGANHD